MEPLHPEIRNALKLAHPGLTDEDIDLTEELLGKRMLCDPNRESEQIAQLDRQRMDLIRQKMPRYAEIVAAVKSRITPATPPRKTKAKVEIKKRRD